MDITLLRERENFKRKAAALPTVSTKRPKFQLENEIQKITNKPDNSQAKAPKKNAFADFRALGKIVLHLKKRHLNQDDYPLTLEDLLDETCMLDLGKNTRNWLEYEALRDNTKIEVTADGRFMYKPPLKIKDGKALVRLLKHYDLKGWGGILLEEVEESLPNCQKILAQREKYIQYIYRPDRKVILFYNDTSCELEIEEQFKSLWRSVNVQVVEDDHIEDYLVNNGIASMKQIEGKKGKRPLPPVRKRKVGKRQSNAKRDNLHLADILEHYD